MRAPVSELKRASCDGVTYYALPQQAKDAFDVSQSDCDAVLRDFQPDFLHVEGAEMAHARRFLSAWKGPRLVSMQGVLNGYAPYELGMLPLNRMLRPSHPRLALTALALLAHKRFRFSPRLAPERQIMKSADHLMGRTLWDRAQAYALNPKAKYHHCSRILRDPFNRHHWTGRDAEPYTIFCGNAGQPRKGIHVALEALAILKREFPAATLIIAGENPFGLGRRQLKRYVGYPIYLKFLIERLGLRDQVRFTGLLKAEEMAQRMACSHVYLMSSLIENSPNTLGEAMMLGMPCVSAYAGGVSSMAQDESEVLFYRALDPAMLAYQVRRVFADPDLASALGQAARDRASITHDPKRNLADLIKAYSTIAGKSLDER